MPGDRANECKGMLVPVDVETNSQKGFIIIYKCERCNQTHKNKMAQDDEMSTIYKIMNKTYDKDKY